MTEIHISAIQHYCYCKRQWGLLYIENLWKDNYLTLDGDYEHKIAHSDITERRKDIITEHGTYIKSEKYHLVGQCDIIEYKKDNDGIEIKNQIDKYKIYPVEYKHGDGSSVSIDKYQLLAQIFCLEEMFQTEINTGFLYYKASNKKIRIDFNQEDRQLLEKIIQEIHDFTNKKHTPITKYNSKKCKNCSMLDICNPKILKHKNIKEYMKEIIK